jgi:hypothetical protein
MYNFAGIDGVPLNEDIDSSIACIKAKQNSKGFRQVADGNLHEKKLVLSHTKRTGN